MNPVIIVPTYVSARRRREGGSLLSTYDHMTSLSQQGELPRLLRSLVDVEGVGQIIVLVVTEPSIEAQAAEKIQQIAAQFPQLSIAVMDAPEEALLQQRLGGIRGEHWDLNEEGQREVLDAAENYSWNSWAWASSATRSA